MVINLVPFDGNRPMSETKATQTKTGVKQTKSIPPLSSDRDARDEFEEVEALEQKASKLNRRKKRAKSKKQDHQYDDFGIYTNQQTSDHHLKEEQLEEPPHKVDVKV